MNKDLTAQKTTDQSSLERTAPRRHFKLPRVMNINLSVVICLLILFPFIEPATPALQVLLGDSIGVVVSSVISKWHWFSLAAAVFWFLCNQKLSSIKFAYVSLLVLLLCGFLLLSTYMNGSLSLANIKTLASIFALFLLYETFRRDKILTLIDASYYWLTIIMLLNSVTIYAYYPDGMYMAGANELNPNYYLFALDNVGFMYAIVGSFLGAISCEIRYKKITACYCLLWGFILGAYVYAQTGTGTAITLAFCLCLFVWKLKIISFVDYHLTIAVCTLAFIGITVLNTLGIFEGVLDLIGKDMTFTGRTDIWEAAFYLMRNHRFLGYGITDATTSAALATYGIAWLSGIGHLHNIVVEFLFKGGLINTFVFVIILLLPYKHLQIYRAHPIANLLCIEFLLLWLTLMFEFRFTTYTFWILLICMYSVKELISASDDVGRHRGN